MSRSVPLPVIRGRGAATNPPNRFERLHVERDGWTEADDPAPGTILLEDRTRSALSRNDSPDVGYDVGLNPYRGCEHGCSYCYARPTHEYLGFSAGLDFETRILVKRAAPELLRAALASPRWRPQPIMLSGVTDPYQPAERRLRVTRRCLEVLAACRNPVSISTKSRLVVRDTDLLSDLARHHAARASLSITTLESDVQRVMEPRAASPARRLDAIRCLADAGVPVGVNVAPVVPGLTDHEMPFILEAAAEAGATFAHYVVLRLPWGVKDLFEDWLARHFPNRREKVLNRIREMHGGRLYDGRFAVRGRGVGPWADHLHALFRVQASRLGLGRPPELSSTSFRRPADVAAQTDLFV